MRCNRHETHTNRMQFTFRTHIVPHTRGCELEVLRVDCVKFSDNERRTLKTERKKEGKYKEMLQYLSDSTFSSFSSSSVSSQSSSLFSYSNHSISNLFDDHFAYVKWKFLIQIFRDSHFKNAR